MKRVILVHCWEGNPEDFWYPKVKEDLEKKGFSVNIPAMPETDLPKLSLWLPKLKETIGEPDENLYLVGHSTGVVTILRYLESLEENQKIGGVVLVAGFTDNIGYSELSNFFTNPIDFEKIKQHCKKFIAIVSDNDPFVDIKYGHEFENKLGAKLIIKSGVGHFDQETLTSLPEVSEAILSLS